MKKPNKKTTVLIVSSIFAGCAIWLYAQLHLPSPASVLNRVHNTTEKMRLTDAKDSRPMPAKKGTQRQPYARQLNQLLATAPLGKDAKNRVLHLIKEWGYLDAAAATTYIATRRELDLDTYLSLNSELLLLWSNKDAPSAFTFTLNTYSSAAQLHLLPKMLLGICDTASDVGNCISALSGDSNLDQSLAIVADGKMVLEGAFNEAFIWANAISDAGIRSGLHDEIGNNWANLDPAAAFDWALKHREIQRLGLRAVTQMAMLDPWQAQRMALEAPEEYQQNLVNAIVQAQASLDNYDVVLAIMDSPPGTKFRSILYKQFIEPWALYNPHEAVSYLIDKPQSKARDEQLVNAVRYWGEQNPQLAIAETAELKDVDLQKKVWVSILSGWCRKDITAATAWVQQQTPSPTLDKVIVQVGNTLVGQGIANHLVVSWVSAIENPGLRASMLAKAENAHYRIDEES